MPCGLAGRRWKIREVVVTPAGHPIDRTKVSGVPVLFQNDRGRADRRFPRRDAGVTIGPLGAKGVPRLGAHRFIKRRWKNILHIYICIPVDI